ncbi:unnamed protein product [Plutella xylostella]|uniref:(diamondback moth) hypothetical protein n=1 Tax=Plutella xylostella TaxID=51655 RepID=A0A8S4DP59_PLUXY|nr:unnamed protein product [Plutella xylostella]
MTPLQRGEVRRRLAEEEAGGAGAAAAGGVMTMNATQVQCEPHDSVVLIKCKPAMGSSVTGIKKCDEDTMSLESGHMFYHQEGDQLSQGG